MVDDVLDFTSTAEQLGKPRYQDIASGNLTAPALLAMKKCPELVELVEAEFLEEGSLERAVHLIEHHGGAHPAPISSTVQRLAQGCAGVALLGAALPITIPA